MKFQITGGGWPVGQWLIPAGTILDSDDWTWGGLPLPKSLPITAMPLDLEADTEMRRQHPHHHHHIQRLAGSDFEWEREFHRTIQRGLRQSQ